MKKLSVHIVVTLGLFLGLVPLMNAQLSAPKFGKGLQITGQDSSFYLKIGARFQNLVIADWSLEDTEAGYEPDVDVTAMVRRSRLKFDGWITNPKLKYKLELALSNRDNGGGNNSNFGNAANIILDAYVQYTFYKKMYIKFGQGKLAGNRERVISSGNLQFVDRSRLNSRFTIDRDLFIQLGNSHKLGDNFIIKESASVGLGEGKNQLEGFNDGFDYTFRLEMLPFGNFESKGDYIGSAIKRESTPKLAIGVTYDANVNSVRERGQKGDFILNSDGDFVGKDLNTLFIDMMFKYQGLSIMAEYADKAVADGIPFVFDKDGTEIGKFYTGSAYNVALGYMFKTNYEIAARFTDVVAETSNNERHYTVGLNKFFYGHKLKIQTDFSLISREGKQNTGMWRTQVDVHF
jgi:hypothetical protein